MSSMAGRKRSHKDWKPLFSFETRQASPISTMRTAPARTVCFGCRTWESSSDTPNSVRQTSKVETKTMGRSKLLQLRFSITSTTADQSRMQRIQALSMGAVSS